MKVVKENFRGEEKGTVTVRIPKTVLNKLGDLSKKHGISRQDLISSILDTALKDKKFKIVV